MSHKEHILAFIGSELTVIRSNGEGTPEAFRHNAFTPRSDYVDNVLFNHMQYATEITWRDTAEFWPETANPLVDSPARHRQILPYAPLTQIAEGIKRYAVYQRVKGIGESRLLRGHSIGFGGHLTGKYAQYDDHGGIVFQTSVHAGLKAEMGEECHVDIDAPGVQVIPWGYINSVMSPVDALHFSYVIEVQVPADYPVLVNEKGLNFKGFFTKEEIIQMHEELPKEIGFESWSRMLIEHGLQ
jgi:predicted NUDIX family phosphoesterase